MNDKYVIVFTKTNWNEAPRIRHQVTNLLLENSKKVIFFQKASNISSANNISKINDNFFLVEYYEPLHHQLKCFNLLNFISDAIVKKNIKYILKKFDVDYIVNFNYDYTFLRDIFPNNNIITIINDDFVAQAKKYRKTMANKLLKKTCINSDTVLGVSYSLVDKLKKYNENTKLFLPWAQHEYEEPNKKTNRNTVLFYGYINKRLDWYIVKEILEKGINIRFIGPIDKESSNIVETLKEKYINFEYAGTSSIEELNCDDILVSIIPYRNTLKTVQAITINNKSFNLLAKGIPLMYPKLPNLIKTNKNIITEYENIDDIIGFINYYNNNFYKLQLHIEEFLQKNYAANRINYLEYK